MKLNAGTLKRLGDAIESSAKISEVFSEFCEASRWLGEDAQSPLRGLVGTSLSEDGMTFEVNTSPVTIRFVMKPILNKAQNVARGQVACVLVSPVMDGSVPVVLGVFNFRRNSQVDDGLRPDGDRLSVVDDACLIVEHFLLAALESDLE